MMNEVEIYVRPKAWRQETFVYSSHKVELTPEERAEADRKLAKKLESQKYDRLFRKPFMCDSTCYRGANA